MGLVSISIRTHFLAFNGFPSVTPEPTPTATIMTPRRRRPVFFTLGSLLISILQKVLKRMHIVSTKPKGNKAKFLDGIEHHWLAILSFFDDHIIVIEKVIENIFPTSTRVFDKIDEFVKASESFPSKLDDFIDHDVPVFLQRVPFLDRVFRKDEKEIVIDITCHGYRVEPENSFEYVNAVKPDREQINMKSGEENATWTSKSVSNLSEVEVFDDADKENNEESMEDANAEILYSARATSSNDEILHESEDQDPIFELFETGWHKSPRSNLSSTSSA